MFSLNPKTGFLRFRGAGVWFGLIRIWFGLIRIWFGLIRIWFGYRIWFRFRLEDIVTVQ